MENTQKPEAFVFIAKGCKYTCVSYTTLGVLRDVGVDIAIANESLSGWGYDAWAIREELHTLGVDYKQYRYRAEAPLNTKQLQALVHFYLSLKDLDNDDGLPKFI